jgi:hypothetical protein
MVTVTLPASCVLTYPFGQEIARLVWGIGKAKRSAKARHFLMREALPLALSGIFKRKMIFRQAVS